MMYNPYNWQIRKVKEDFDECNDYNCVLDELGRIGYELDVARIKGAKLKDELGKCNENIIKLEKKKLLLIDKLVEKP